MLLPMRYEMADADTGGGAAVADPAGPTGIDGAGATLPAEAAPQAAPDTSPAASAPAIEESVTAPADGAETAPDADAADAAEADDPDALSPDVIRAVIEKHKPLALEALREDIEREKQAERDRTAQELRAAPEADQQWQQFTRGAADAGRRVLDALQRRRDGLDQDDDPGQLAEDFGQLNVYTEAATRRDHYVAYDGIHQAFVDRIMATPDGLDPSLVSAHEALVNEAREIYSRMEKAVDKKGQPDQAARAAAWDYYAARVIPAGWNLAKADGKREGLKEAREQFERDVKIKENNAELRAYARIADGAGAPTQPKGGETVAAPLTRDNMLKGDWRDFQKLVNANGHRI